MESSASKSSLTEKPVSNTIYSFIDSVKNSVSKDSTKISDMVEKSSPLLLTDDIKSPVSKTIIEASSTKEVTPLVKGEKMDINNLSKLADTGGSWFNVGNTGRIWIKVLLVILLLGFIGINIFFYLGFSVKKIYGLLDKFVNYIKALLSGKKTKSISKQIPKPKFKTKDKPKNMKDLENEIEQPKKNTPPPKVKPDEDKSTIHTSGKSGYCNVGSWKGIRSCVKVADASECISGDIFPTKEICINPNLRS